ncbi:MAG TPA: bifunctional UDP-sugar hydrolase/5'-nucleotidase [Candidatus Rifleibacterium sp.]|nr:bifunctional UDP-sugar hydrolase/5'-nucleotidase [Candidatus Rifleibacterium sp.]HPT46323.1 bifunctional UDP-sugar hydrolase/5'-nucleotidase [Candidatus Rifleibacterium sp.]
MVRNLAVLALAMICLLAGMIGYDWWSIPSRNLIIFYTSNLRGQIKPFSGTVLDRQYEQIGGLAFIRGFINDSSRAFSFNPQNVLLLDTGDSLFGTAEASLTMGEVPLRLMGKAGYDAMTIGNMEFEYGFETLRSFVASNHVPMLACNYRDVTSPVGETFKGSLMIEKGGIKVGIIGLGHGQLARNTRQDNIVNLEIVDMKTSVQKSAALLREKGAEVIILLSHHPEVGGLENPTEVFPDVDIIIGDLIGPGAVVSGKPMICQTAPGRGGGVGMVKVSFVGGKWDIAKGFQRIFTIDSSKTTPDPELAAEISRVEAKIDSLLDEVITQSSNSFSYSYTEESAIGNLIADCMRETAGTQVALTNSGGIKTSLASGPVTLRHLYDILPFENNLVTVDIGGWQLENLIEESLSGKTGFLQASGLSCTYSSSNPAGFRIIQIDVGNEPLEFDATYSVAINDFMYSNDFDWPELSNGSPAKVKGLIRENLEKYLRRSPSVTPSIEKRFNDFAELDETLRIQALSYELASLSKPLSHDGTTESEYCRLVAEVMRLETGVDFAVLPVDLVNKTREPLVSITPARVISDFSSAEGLKVLEISGSDFEKLVSSSLASGGRQLAFSGFSIEKLDGKRVKFYPWTGDFNPEHLYKIAITENFPIMVPGFYDLTNVSSKKVFNDLRRAFINGLRRRNGQVEIKRAFY